MSEYQRYEFMTVDRPLTAEELKAVNQLSSHIEANSTYAFIEYSWGDFKHDPIKVLHKFFDGFLYWANWGSPQLAFRFPHGVLPADLLEGYYLEDYVTLTPHEDYDILNFEFGEMEAPDEWLEYSLGSMIAIRDELLNGDLRSLYIAWLASEAAWRNYEEDEQYYARDEVHEADDEDDMRGVPVIPTGFKMLTAAQQSLAQLLQVPSDLLAVVARHSSAGTTAASDDVEAWVELLPLERGRNYLVRLARNEAGLSRKLLKELRDLGRGEAKAPLPEGERVNYVTLLAESRALKAEREREQRLKERQAREQHLQEIHDHEAAYWQQVEQAAALGTSSGYDKALQFLLDLRAAADQFRESRQFQTRFQAWAQRHLRRPALLRRLREHHFPVPE